MDQFDRILSECKHFQQILRELESTTVPVTQESVKQIQIEFLKANIQKLGQKLLHLSIYRNRRDKHDGQIPE